MADATQQEEIKRQLNEQARLFKDLVDTPGFKMLQKVVEAQIQIRQNILLTPLDQLPDAFRAMDFQSRAAAMEAIKGAIMGLRLAIETPSATIAQVKASTAAKKDNGDA